MQIGEFRPRTAILIIFEGQFQVFQRFSSSKLVVKAVESCSGTHQTYWFFFFLRVNMYRFSSCDLKSSQIYQRISAVACTCVYVRSWLMLEGFCFMYECQLQLYIILNYTFHILYSFFVYFMYMPYFWYTSCICPIFVLYTYTYICIYVYIYIYIYIYIYMYCNR